MKKALVVIDVQNDYFSSGNLPLWNADKTLDSIVDLISSAKKSNVPVILIQHVVESGPAPFFAKNSPGVDIHPRILEAAPDAPIIIKGHADAFLKTNLESVLDQTGVEKVVICGMMTHNCVTHTALSKAADKYKVSVLPDACTTVSELMHGIAIAALAPREILRDSL